MERISKDDINLNPTSGNKLKPSTRQWRNDSNEKAQAVTALITIINKIRMLKSWDVLPAGKAEDYALVWLEALHSVPAKHFNRLYLAAVETQAVRRRNGQSAEDIRADSLLTEWFVLQRQLVEEEIERGRTLTANAASVCRHCGGSNWRSVGEGRGAPVRRCDHED
jgi:hypothetical protein